MAESLRNIKILVQYDGTDYHGWQIQENHRTIQGELTRALSLIDGREVTVHGSGRTDAGVHAAGQVANFLFAHPHRVERLRGAINGNLPRDIRVMAVEEVAPDFHARFSARSKTYHYHVFLGPVLSPFQLRYVHHCTYALDLDLITRAATRFEGEHDFRSFTATPETEINTVRHLTQCRVQVNAARQLLTFELAANGFLRYMVRSIVGTLIDIGRGHLPLSSLDDIFAARSRWAAGTTVPAKGLTLVQVTY